jgi:beta-galactosidase/beta-glucuronidase
MQTHLPRPEYPRPQFVRQEWLNLNGEWEFAFDDADVGLSEGWWDGRPLDLRIQVPFAYQSELSGIHDRGIHEVVWYARTLEVPEEWRKQDVLLHFGAVDYRATVWINGVEVGHNRGGHVPFRFDIAPYLTDGPNRLTVRVQDLQDPHQPRGKQSSSGVPSGIDYYCTTGIWQTVWLEPVPKMRIDGFTIVPDADRQGFRLSVYLHAPSIGWQVEVEVLDGEESVATRAAFCTGAAAQIHIPIPNAKLWSPDSPHLYDFRIRLLRKGMLVDEVTSYAGMRSLEIRDGWLHLNGEPIYLCMVLDQGYWPGGYLTPPSDDAIRADVEWTRKFGFNGARKHQKIEDPRYYYWCDRLGLLVWAEMPNARAWSPEGEEQLLAEWERAVCRDCNHPSIITWVPVNESMGFPHLRDGHPGQYAFLERIVTQTRQLDPTRPVIDNDGWEHTDVTDIVAIHDYSHTGERLRERYAETLRGGPLPPAIWSGSRQIFARGSSHHGQPVMLTEVGGFLLLPDAPAEELDRIYRVYDSFHTPRELLTKYEDLMLNGIAELTFVTGFCYTQLTDIEQELNGLLTFDRRPKVDPAALADIHRRLRERRRNP